MTENEPAESRKRLVIFHAQDAKAPEPERMPREGIDDAVLAGLARLAAQDVKPGIGERTLVLFSEPGDHGFSLLYIWFKSCYVLPRHSHDSDCLYCVIGGELRLGSHVLRKGDGMFIPAHHAYGYEAGPDGVEILEFRNATRFNLMFKPNDGARWDRIAETFQDRAALWAAETVPPSDRRSPE
jgi:quercetin dioxygenase-like cupin family protein